MRSADARAPLSKLAAWEHEGNTGSPTTEQEEDQSLHG